jgi:hypothetical protein
LIENPSDLGHVVAMCRLTIFDFLGDRFHGRVISLTNEGSQELAAILYLGTDSDGGTELEFPPV